MNYLVKLILFIGTFREFLMQTNDLTASSTFQTNLPSSSIISSDSTNLLISSTKLSSLPSISISQSVATLPPGIVTNAAITSSLDSTPISISSTPLSIPPSTISNTASSNQPSFDSHSFSATSTSALLFPDTSMTSTVLSFTSNKMSSDSSDQSTLSANTVSSYSATSLSSSFSSSVFNTQTGSPTAMSLNTDQVLSPYWVQTGCEIDITTNITNVQYKINVEQNLSRAYNEGYNLAQLKTRVKRATTIGVNTLQLVDINRVLADQKPSNLIYYVKTTSNSFVPPSTVISNMNQLSLQQMSLFLGVPVTTVATYFDPAIQNPNYDQKLWIIGAVFGSLAGAGFIVWIVLFTYTKCIKPWDEPLIENDSIDSESGTYMNYSEYSKNIQNIVNIPPTKEISSDVSLKSKNKFEKNITINEETNLGNETIINANEEVKKSKKYLSFSSVDSYSKIDSLDEKQESEVQNNELKSHSEKKSKRDKKHSKKSNKHDKKEIKNENSDQFHVEINNEAKIKGIEKNSPLRSEKNSLTCVEDDKILVIEKMKEILDKDENKKSINLIEVKPTIIQLQETEFSEIIQPVPFVDTYSSVHLFPKYRDEDIIISDTSLNLIKYKASDELEKEKKDLMQRKSIKDNLRTLKQLPRKNTSIDTEMSSKQLVNELNYEISESNKNNMAS